MKEHVSLLFHQSKNLVSEVTSTYKGATLIDSAFIILVRKYLHWNLWTDLYTRLFSSVGKRIVSESLKSWVSVVNSCMLVWCVR